MELVDLLRQVVETFERLRIPYLVTGSVASMAYGEPRLTNDIDIVAGVDVRHIPELLQAFPADTFYIDGEMMRESIRRRTQFNIIHPVSGLKIDVMIRQETPFDRSRFDRIRRISPAASFQANFAAPEDVIIKKMVFYQAGGSDKHLRDITGILRISGAEIDRAYIADWCSRLDLETIWTAIQARLAAAD